MEDNSIDINTMKMMELKEELRKRNLDNTGDKNELRRRLTEVIETEQRNAEISQRKTWTENNEEQKRKTINQTEEGKSTPESNTFEIHHYTAQEEIQGNPQTSDLVQIMQYMQIINQNIITIKQEVAAEIQKVEADIR